MATQQGIVDNHIRAMSKAGRTVTSEDLESLHQTLVESVLHGYDVLSSAVHLTASTLSLLAPKITFESMNLNILHLGEQSGGGVRLGSLEYLTQSSLTTQTGLMSSHSWIAETISGTGGQETKAPLPDLDFCVMNPPFTRSVGGNLLFGSLPDDQRKRMQKSLTKLLKNPFWTTKARDYANVTAGLGSVFVAIADTHLKTDGRLALVLPAALETGVAWEKTRKLLSLGYDTEYLIVSHDPDRWYFSENTDITEVLFVGTKINRANPRQPATVSCINVWKNFETPVDALAFADAVARTAPAPIEGRDGSFPISSVMVGGTKRAEIVSVSWDETRNGQWYMNNFAQTDVLRAAHFLRKGKIFLPASGLVREICLTSLGDLGSFGPDVRDVTDGFTHSAIETSYPAFVSHSSKTVLTLSQMPNMYLEPRTIPAKKRKKIVPVHLLWPRAGSILVAERLRLTAKGWLPF